jgi:hypothetical protein
MTNKVTAYLSAGVDESLITFAKHLASAVFVAAVNYAVQHFTKSTITSIRTLAPFVVGFPIVTSLSKWLTTTANNDPAVGKVNPIPSTFSVGDTTPPVA